MLLSHTLAVHTDLPVETGMALRSGSADFLTRLKGVCLKLVSGPLLCYHLTKSKNWEVRFKKEKKCQQVQLIFEDDNETLLGESVETSKSKQLSKRRLP